MLKKILYFLWASVFLGLILVSLQSGSSVSFVHSMENSTFDMEWKLSAARVELILAEMSWMNLIVNTGETSKNPNIKLTEEGFAAYKDHRFYSIAASLMEAKESRLLATIAIVVSFVTLIATIIGIWCN